MRSLKHFLLLTILFIGVNFSATALGILSAEQQDHVIENVSSFMQGLNLSERDKPAFRDVISDFFIGLVALRATDFPVATNKKVIKALIKGRDARVKGLLSSDQYKVYSSHVKERQASIKSFMKQQL